MSKERLLILDGHSLAFRAFFSRPPENFITTTGVYTNAVHGFFLMLISMIREYRPTHIAAAFDLSRHSFRTELYPEYKGGRGETPPEFLGQPENIQRVLDALRITWLAQENIEADDILATLAGQAATASYDVLVFSGDRDTFQLVTDQVSVLYPGRTIAETTVMTPQAVKEKYDVWPAQYPELAALVGEKADNLPGVPLVGPKVAAQWINKYGGLEGIYAHATELGGKRGENLRAHLNDVKRNRQLNALRTDLELPVNLDDLRWCEFDWEAVNSICDEFEFTQMRRKILQLGQELGMEISVAQASALKINHQSDAMPQENATGNRTKRASAKNEKTSSYALLEPVPADFSDYGKCPEPRIYQLGRGLSAAGFTEWLPRGDAPFALWAVGNISVTDSRIEYLMFAKTERPADAKHTGEYSAVLVIPTQLAPAEETALASALENPHTKKITYDAKALRHALMAHGWKLSDSVIDLNLEDYLSDSDASRSKFAQVTQRILGWAIDEKPSDTGKIAQQLSFDLDDLSVPTATDNALLTVSDLPATLVNQAVYASALLQMEPFVTSLLVARAGEQLREIEYPLANMLSRMETTGIAVDERVLLNYAKELEHEVAQAQSAAYESIGREVNLSSPKQLQEILFTQLQLPATRKTKTGYSTDAKALEELSQLNPHPFLDALLYHRDRIKLLQIVRSLSERIGSDGRIHTTYGQAVAATGRLSSIDPNLQNIPARTQDGARIREAFVAGQDFANLMSVDYSQIEMRLMAHMSGDEALIAAFAAGEDLHRSVAALVFGIEPADVTSTQRSQVKATSYGLAYGLSAFGLARQLRISQKEAKSLMESYFGRFHNVRDYLENVVTEARRVGYTETMFGRRRYFPGLLSSNHTVAEMARRAALNAPIQGSAADLMKKAMLAVDRAIIAAGLHSRVLLQVHDELILEVAQGEATFLKELVRREMSNAAQLRVPLAVSVGIGPNWLSATH